MLKRKWIKSRVEAKVCKVHGEHPELMTMGTDFVIICCCDNFKNECVSEAESLLTSKPKLILESVLSKAFHL